MTRRDAVARDIVPVLSLGEPRPPEQWPEVKPRPVPAFDAALLPPDLPLSVLGHALLNSVLAFEKALGAKVPTISAQAKLSNGQALAMMRDNAYIVFPGLRG